MQILILIISQETCEVCAAYTNQVNKAVQILGENTRIAFYGSHNVGNSSVSKRFRKNFRLGRQGKTDYKN